MGEDLREHFKLFSADNKLSVLLCMLAYQEDDIFYRELVVFNPPNPPKQIDVKRLVSILFFLK